MANPGTKILVESLRKHRQRKFAHAAIAGLASRLLGVVFSALSIGLILPSLGQEEFGIVATITTTATWIGLANLGLGNGLLTRLSNSGVDSKERIVSSTFLIALVLTGVTASIILLSWICLPVERIVGKLVNADSYEVRVTILFVALSSCCMIFLNLGASVLHGEQRGDIADISRSFATVISILLLATLISSDLSMPFAAITLLLPNLITGLVQLIAAFWFGYLNFSRGSVDIECGLETTRLGIKFLVLQGFSLIMFQAGALIIANTTGASNVTPYHVCTRMVMVVSTFVNVLLYPLWPAFGDANRAGDIAWMRRAFWTSMVAVTSMWLAFSLLLLAFGQYTIELWAGAAAVPTQGLLGSILILGFLTGISTPVAFLLNATNKLNSQLYVGILQTIAFIPIAVFLCREFGSIGIPVGQSIVIAVLTLPVTLLSAVCFLYAKTNMKPAHDLA